MDNDEAVQKATSPEVAKYIQSFYRGDKEHLNFTPSKKAKKNAKKRFKAARKVMLKRMK